MLDIIQELAKVPENISSSPQIKIFQLTRPITGNVENNHRESPGI